MVYVAETPLAHDVEKSTSSTSGGSLTEEEILLAQIAQEKGHDVKYRTCSWQKTAALLFSEYICLSVLSFPWSFSVLGIVPGVIVTFVVATMCLYTSVVLWRYCLKHPEVRDICDIGQKLFGGSQLAYNVTSVFFILNNIFVQAVHILVGTKLLNTLTNSAKCSVIFGVVTTAICFLLTLPRTLKQLSHLGLFSTVSMAIAILLAIIFSGVQTHPFAYIEGEEPIVLLFPATGTTYVMGMSAFLNIAFVLIGQAAIPSFIAEMENPKDFPKALWAVTITEIITYTICGALVYHWVGNQYITSPAFGSLQPIFKKVAFSFAIPTIIFLGSLFSSVTARFVFFRIFKHSRHLHSHTITAWATWIGIITVTLVMSFIIAQVIPFFSDMLGLMCSLFNGWFGFIFWAMAYLSLHPGEAKWNGPLKTLETLMNYVLILIGIYITIAGTYTSIQSIINSYKAQLVGTLFSCASNAI